HQACLIGNDGNIPPEFVRRSAHVIDPIAFAQIPWINAAVADLSGTGWRAERKCQHGEDGRKGRAQDAVHKICLTIVIQAVLSQYPKSEVWMVSEWWNCGTMFPVWRLTGLAANDLRGHRDASRVKLRSDGVPSSRQNRI